MAIARSNRTIPGLRRRPARPRRPVIVSGGASGASAFVQESGTWNFAVRIWIAFDPPTVAAPSWIPISSWVETGIAISIRHGRVDGMADVNATTCTLTVDNSDGRFSAANPTGLWYGLIHKGNWLKVEILPPSGVVSQRFVGFITTLPTAWQGLYATCQITASDRFEKLGNVPNLVSSIQSEVLTDPNLAGNVKAYWNLHESQGSTTFGDTSGSTAQHLLATGLGGPAGTGFAAANAASPGFDGLRCPTFNPPGASTGTYLTGPITSPVGGWNTGTGVYTGLYGTVEFWFQTLITGTRQILACIVDPSGQVGMSVILDTAGHLNLTFGNVSAGRAPGSSSTNFVNLTRADDGKWHHVLAGTAATTAGGGYVAMVLVVDGITLGTLSTFTTYSADQITQIMVGGGYDPVTPGPVNLATVNISDVAWLWADMNTLGTGLPPDVSSHLAAGTTGFSGESTDVRVARIARYAGIPQPLTPIIDSNPFGYLFGHVQRYAAGTTASWTNLAPGAHACGTQNISGRKPLDVAREAARTEGMPLFINRSGYLTLQNSTIRQNTSPAWTVAAVDLDPQTAMPDDFAYTVNQVTVTPNGQATQTVIGTVGAASQLKYGIYDKSQATASLNPVEARSLGAQFVQLGADPLPRLAPLVVEVATLATTPGYGAPWYDAVLATEISTPVRVTSLPAAAGGGPYDILVEGWTETIAAGRHLFAFTTSPVQGPTYQLDDAVLGRADTDGSTLSGGTLNTTALSFQVATTAAGSPLWVTDPAQFPVDVRIDGEQITVSGISGASSPQTFTASARSVNGIVASHTTGTAVSLWQPLTLAY